VPTLIERATFRSAPLGWYLAGGLVRWLAGLIAAALATADRPEHPWRDSRLAQLRGANQTAVHIEADIRYFWQDAVPRDATGR
jgi:hypothetical protein